MFVFSFVYSVFSTVLFCFSFLYSFVFPIFVQGYRLLETRGNPIAGNKYHIKGNVFLSQAQCGAEGG